ncbi:hypothetical protein EMCRGX_G028054 [Ephydatia muelleri]
MADSKGKTSQHSVLRNILVSPPIYLRFVSIVFAILVFGCVSDQVHDTGSCLYGRALNRNSGNIDCCNFATAVGVIGFLLSILFLLKEFLVAVLDFSQYTKFNRVVAIMETVSSSVWAFMWFVAFVFTAHQLRITDPVFLSGNPVAHCARAVVAFSFFSTLLWIGMAIYNAVTAVRITRSDPSSTGSIMHPSKAGYVPFVDASSDTEDKPPSGNTYVPPKQ